MLHFPHFGRKSCNKLRSYNEWIPYSERAWTSLKTAIWPKVMYIQFPEKLLSYDILYFYVADSINGEKQKISNQENFYLQAKCEELLISAANMRDRRKLGTREKAFW